MYINKLVLFKIKFLAQKRCKFQAFYEQKNTVPIELTAVQGVFALPPLACFADELHWRILPHAALSC